MSNRTGDSQSSWVASSTILAYDDRIMLHTDRLDNRVRSRRQARGWTQGELAEAAGLSRTGVSAIEAGRLVPSVAAALGIAQALRCTVEDLFGPRSEAGAVDFAWLPSAFPCRYWLADVGSRTLAFPLENGLRSDLAHDGVARQPTEVTETMPEANRTLVVATCDPAAGYLASLYERQGNFRMLVFTRSSAEALVLVQQGIAHVAGVHFAAAGDEQGNAAELLRRAPDCDLSMIHVAQWEEGLASQPTAKVRSASAAVRSKLRWVGRVPGAAARRHQEDLLGPRRTPRHTANDHRSVVEAIRNEWADLGICLRLTAEEGQLAFLSLGQENYDLCFRRQLADDPRILHLISTICSAEYRRILGELPGYKEQPHFGAVERVAGSV